jgi:hypothetical protein
MEGVNYSIDQLCWTEVAGERLRVRRILTELRSHDRSILNEVPPHSMYFHALNAISEWEKRAYTCYVVAF